MRLLDFSINFFIQPHYIVLGLNQPLKEIRARHFPGDKGHKAYNLTAICEPTHMKHFSKACYGDRFTSLYVDDFRTSVETRVSTACYWDCFTFYM
jgi:hypothetical protein